RRGWHRRRDRCGARHPRGLHPARLRDRRDTGGALATARRCGRRREADPGARTGPWGRPGPWPCVPLRAPLADAPRDQRRPWTANGPRGVPGPVLASAIRGAGSLLLGCDSFQTLELLLGDRRVELDEHRGGLGDRGTDCDRAVLPRGHIGVVTGDHGIAGPPSRSSTSSMRGSGAICRSPPSVFSTALAENGRNGASIVFRSVTAWASTCSTVSRRSRCSGAFSLNGSVSDT